MLRIGAGRTVIALAVLLFAVSFPFRVSRSADAAHVLAVTAERFEYKPSEIHVKKGETVVLEITSLDRLHGFACPDLGIRSDIEPGKVNRVRFVPDRTGTFPFRCDIYCGDGHEGMEGTIVVEA